MPKITTKPDADRFDVHNVFSDGVKVAEFWFCRDRRERDCRVIVRTTGELTTVDGRKIRLDNYGYFADVKRHLPFLIETAR